MTSYGIPFGKKTMPANTVFARLAATAGPGSATAMSAFADAILDELGASLLAAELATMTGTSTTSLAIGTGNKVFTTQANKGFDGQYVRAYSAADPTKWVFGLTTYSGTTATISVAAGFTSGAGTVNDWVLVVAGAPGATGATGAAGDLSAAGNPLLVAIQALNSAAAGVLCATGTSTAAKRTITGTANLITVTNGNGGAGNPTLTVGSNVMRKDQSNTLANGAGIVHGLKTHTVNTSPTLAFSDGEFQKIEYTATAAYTVTLPTTGSGRIVLEVLNTAAITSIGLTNNDKLLTGASGTTLTAINKRNRLVVEVIDGFAVSQWVNVA